MIQIKYSDHLAHHGVKGMHWGVRRYQNYDGTRIGANGRTYTKETLRNNERYSKQLARKNKSSISQDLLAKRIRKESSKTNELVIKSASKEKLDDIADKYKRMNEAMQKASDDYSKQFAYEEDYDKRASEWSLNDIKKNQPDVYSEIIKDAERSGYSPIDHKIVQYGKDGYDDVEPYNPPKTRSTEEADRAFDEYYSSCKKYTEELIGKHGRETISLLDQEYGGAYGDTIERKVMNALEEYSKRR